MSDCTIRIEPGQPIAPHLAEGAVLCLAPGVHPANLVLTTSITLQGEPGAILDGQTKGAVVRTEANKLEITLKGLEIRGGAFELGSGVLLEGYSKLHVQGCTIAGNSASRGGGNGLAAGQRHGEGGSIAGPLTLRGTTSRAPVVVLEGGDALDHAPTVRTRP